MAKCCFQLQARTGLDLYGKKKSIRTDFAQQKKDGKKKVIRTFLLLFIETELKPSTQAMRCSMLFKYKQVAGQGHSV